MAKNDHRMWYTRCFKTIPGPNGRLLMSDVPLSGIGISHDDPTPDRDLMHSIERRIFEDHGRIEPDEPYYRVIGRIELVEPEKKDETNL